MVAAHRDAPAARLGDQLGGVLDGLRSVQRAARPPCAAAGDIHRRAGGAELGRHSPARAAGPAGDQRDLSIQPTVHSVFLLVRCADRAPAGQDRLQVSAHARRPPTGQADQWMAVPSAIAVRTRAATATGGAPGRSPAAARPSSGRSSASMTA